MLNLVGGGVWNGMVGEANVFGVVYHAPGAGRCSWNGREA
jgi:hypothetical protein